LRPWFENLKKRQVKSPKFYVRDSGILLNLLNLQETDLLAHPKLGAAWEGFALEAIIQQFEVDPQECYFWSAPRVGEVDLLLVQGVKRTAFEFKYTDRPLLTKSMLLSLDALQTAVLTIVVPINTDYFLHEKVRVMGLENILKNYC
jgi:predicted AAA+ superfamily ATPase